MITLKDLAATLGVSVSTVSKALKDSPEISKDTITRVKEIAKELNYRPNTLALSLKNRKTKTIGVIIPDILNTFFARILYGIEQESTALGYNIITCLSNETFEKENNSLHLLANGSVDGFIMSVSEETQSKGEVKHLKETINQDVPIVMFDRVANDVDCDKVIIDDFNAAFKATETLIKEGRKKIVLVNSLGELSVGKLRVLGYKKALEKHDSYTADPIVIEVDDDQELLNDQLEKIITEHKDMDGLLCIDNISGVMSVNIAQRLGRTIPNDLSVIGFSSNKISHLSYPPLSTVAQYAEEIGQESVKMLVERLENKTKGNTKTVTINYSIELRGTTLPVS
ncbi:LacI family transcriptional regulator [Nonlabens dokdonensis]|jgi:LacI family transcriptional regulator|uniref:LacI family transcriptional regulator n=2 Tax=Nonlabens dokdonensis TaxID=328515 RepID=L7WAI1_NONDD|nr:LacI family DNA-binding transcriptional regulator [Nonlabens dokdonensis]AGC77212.1 LacI family transcriptional regulator [Nonlabens dokdonensis DSW-6]PZX40750.1 LacI family transcriptional regulator [Nonlabens dokdonensis]